MYIWSLSLMFFGLPTSQKVLISFAKSVNVPCTVLHTTGSKIENLLYWLCMYTRVGRVVSPKKWWCWCWYSLTFEVRKCHSKCIIHTTTSTNLHGTLSLPTWEIVLLVTFLHEKMRRLCTENLRILMTPTSDSLLVCPTTNRQTASHTKWDTRRGVACRGRGVVSS